MLTDSQTACMFREHGTLIPPTITKQQSALAYANEADLLNVALFGQTEKPAVTTCLAESRHLEKTTPPASPQAAKPLSHIGPPTNELQAYLRGEAKTVTDHFSPALSGIQLERVRGLTPGQTMKDLLEHLQPGSFGGSGFPTWTTARHRRPAICSSRSWRVAWAASAVGSSNSPVKRLNDRGQTTDEGRQIDCYDGESQLAYEFKLRFTIAASGQGRFAEELSLPVECRAAGLTPVLVVLDPTPSPRLTELIAKFVANEGRHYVGADAWSHMDSKAGKTMAVFLERYIRPPLTEMATHEDTGPEPIQLSWSPEEILIRGSNECIRIPRRV